MSKKVHRPVTIAPLQRIVAEPITDPAEKAALDRARKRAKGSRPIPKAKSNGRRPTPSKEC